MGFLWYNGAMRLQLPQQGQPIDVQYLYTIVEAVNSLAESMVSVTHSHYTTIDTAEAGRQSVKTSQAMIYGGVTQLVTNEDVVSNTSKTWHVELPPGFKYSPRVTCSVINRGTSSVGNDVVLAITNVSKDRIDGTAKFLSSGVASVSVSVIAVGIPE